MTHWSTKDVRNWLNAQGFGAFAERFKERNINGESLLTLSNENIRQLLLVSDQNEIQNQRIVEEFQRKLHTWKVKYNAENNSREAEIVNSLAATSLTVTDENVKKELYTKNYLLSVEKNGTGIKFFGSNLFRIHLRQYLSNTYSIECHFRSIEAQGIDIELSGIKHNVKTAREIVKSLFQSIQVIVFERTDTDQQLIYWMQNIPSESIISVIQEIMNKEQIFTTCEKTAVFSGYLKTCYFTQEPFATTADKITDILLREIVYIPDISMPNEKTKSLIKSIDQFISNRQYSELAFIQCRYPCKIDIKISLFGRKHLVRKIKKQLQSIINKHTIQSCRLKLNAVQEDYLLENCMEQIQDIENEYQDDNVKIRIRHKEFCAPQYLLGTIKQKLSEMIFYSTICRFRKIGDVMTLTDHERKQIDRIARRNYCRLEKIESETDWIICSIPKALSQSVPASNLVIQRSNELCSSLTMKKISILKGSIEIYLTNQTNSIPRDVTIISSRAGALEERIEYSSDNGYIEMKTGKKYLFDSWSPVISNDDNNIKMFKRSVEKFVSSTLQGVVDCCSDAQKIAFSTNEWEDLDVERQKQLVESLINGIKQEFEIRKENWTILFLFNYQQMNLYRVFYRILTKRQTEQDGFAQISCPVSMIIITLTTSSSIDLRRAEQQINAYVHEQILTDASLSLEFNLRQWDQHMLNAFYNYCLRNSVLPQINLINDSQLQLIGSVSDVEKATSKCKLMFEISHEKSTGGVATSIMSGSSVPGTGNPSDNSSTGHNIYFSYCSFDKSICNEIATCLINEGYSVSRGSSKKSSSSDIEKSDVILVGFSEKYSTSSRCLAELNRAKSKRKIVIPFVIRQITGDNQWLTSLAITEVFYDLFDREIDLEFIDDFDLEYDQLLSTLLRYTKPGIVDQRYPLPRATKRTENNTIDDQEIIFGHRPAALQKLTEKQNSERQLIYQVKVKKNLEMNKIPEDEIDSLVSSLRGLIDDIEAILREEDHYGDRTEEQQGQYSRGQRSWKFDQNCQAALYAFLNCLKRWLDKAPEVTRNNFAPFTPTGDINDAIFTIYRSPGDENYEQTPEPFDISAPSKYFSVPSDLSSSFTDEQAHEYFEKLIRKTKPVNDMETELAENETAWKLNVSNQPADKFVIGNELKTPEEIRKRDGLDDPNRVWTKTRGAPEFIRQKIKNILEFQDLCNKSA